MGSIPFGLRDVKIAPISAAGVVGTLVDLPNAQTFSFSENEDYTEMRGDDVVKAKRGNGATVDWTLEAGGITLEAYAIMSGGSVVIIGTEPAVTKRTFSKLGTTAKPYFYVEGQAMSDSGGDFHAVVYKCIADGGLEGELADGEFWVSSASGTGIANVAGKLYDFVENSTATAIVAPAP